MERDALKIMSWLYAKEDGVETFNGLLKECNIRLNPPNEVKFKNYLLNNKLIDYTSLIILIDERGQREEPPDEFCLTYKARDIINDYSYYKALDSILNFFYQNSGNKIALYSLQEVCEIIGITYHQSFYDDLVNNSQYSFLQCVKIGIDERFTLKKYAGQKVSGGDFFQRLHLQEFKERMEAKENNQHSTTGGPQFHGSFTGNYTHSGSNLEQSYSQNETPQEKEKSFWGKHWPTIVKVIGGLGAIAGLITFILKSDWFARTVL